jgi:hypothetical protein
MAKLDKLASIGDADRIGSPRSIPQPDFPAPGFDLVKHGQLRALADRWRSQRRASRQTDHTNTQCPGQHAISPSRLLRRAMRRKIRYLAV